MWPCTARSRRGSPPATHTRPAETDSKPVTARVSVVFPAPFGPSSPVTPGPNEHDSSDSATFGPKNTDTPETTTVGWATKAGSSDPSVAAGAPTDGPGAVPGALVTAPPSGSASAAPRP